MNALAPDLLGDENVVDQLLPGLILDEIQLAVVERRSLLLSSLIRQVPVGHGPGLVGDLRPVDLADLARELGAALPRYVHAPLEDHQPDEGDRHDEHDDLGVAAH